MINYKSNLNKLNNNLFGNFSHIVTLLAILFLLSTASCSFGKSKRHETYNDYVNPNYVYHPRYPGNHSYNLYSRVPGKYGTHYDYDRHYSAPKYYNNVNHDNYAPKHGYTAKKEDREFLILPTLSISLIIGLIILSFVGF